MLWGYPCFWKHPYTDITKGYITFTILTFTTTTQTISNLPKTCRCCTTLSHGLRQERKQQQSPECATWEGVVVENLTCENLCKCFFYFGRSSSINIYHRIDFQGTPVWRKTRAWFWMFWVTMWVFPKIGVPQNGWFIMENRIKRDDLGGPSLFLETPMYSKEMYLF